MRSFHVEGMLKRAIVLLINGRKYVVYLSLLNNSNVIKISKYSKFEVSTAQILCTFVDSVDMAYDGKYFYITSNSKITKGKISIINDKFYFEIVSYIQLPYNDSRIQSIAATNNGKVAIFDMKDGNIYEIENDELKFVRCTRSKYAIAHQELYYKNDEVRSNFDTKPWHTTEQILKEYEYAIKDRSIKLLYYNESTEETIFGLSNALVFEKNGMFNGFILFETRKIVSITSYASFCNEDIILCCNGGEILVLSEKDVRTRKQKSIKEIMKVRDKKAKIIQMIAYCSGSDEEVLLKFAQEFKYRGLEMYYDIKEIKDNGLTGKDALNEYYKLK